MNLNNNLMRGSLLFALAMSAIACSKDKGPDNERESNEVEFFIAANQSSASYLLAVPEIESQ